MEIRLKMGMKVIKSAGEEWDSKMLIEIVSRAVLNNY